MIPNSDCVKHVGSFAWIYIITEILQIYSYSSFYPPEQPLVSLYFSEGSIHPKARIQSLSTHYCVKSHYGVFESRISFWSSRGKQSCSPIKYSESERNHWFEHAKKENRKCHSWVATFKCDSKWRPLHHGFGLNVHWFLLLSDIQITHWSQTNMRANLASASMITVDIHV